MRKRIGTAMVVGAGISGIRSALDLAEFGYRVTLVDKAPHIGGILSQLDYQFPSDGCGMCKMLPLVDRDAASQYCLRKGLFHENITIVLNAELTALDGEPGNFRATIRQKPACVDPGQCIGCGECTRVCPVEVRDDFNMGFGRHKAIYLPVPHNIPNTYTIELTSCNRCGECINVCPTGAIRLPEERRKKFHILVVDDELIVRDSLREWLADEGFSVDMADSGQTALSMLSEKRYHLMLTDIKMPGMDGVELLKQAAQYFPELPIVMMTAYATVETAVDALKTGALDYLLKPFDPGTFTPKILDIYQRLEVIEERRIDVNALVLTTGTDYFNPEASTNTFGYGRYPDVVTSREFERLISGTGPGRGRLARPSDQGEVRKIAWFQCVGSRDRQVDADFCSSVCCMHAVKQARLVKDKFGAGIDTTIFYMDMRAFNKGFHAYVDQARDRYKIRFEKSRVHSVIENPGSGGILARYSDQEGDCHEDGFDLVVLSVGQRPSKGADAFAEICDINVNPWGFCTPEPFSTSLTRTEGIFLGGSFTGLTDISESIIRSGSAALSASRFMHAKGQSLANAQDDPVPYRDVAREQPRILVLACACGRAGFEGLDKSCLKKALLREPAAADVVFTERACTRQGWDALTDAAVAADANRILIATCLSDACNGRIRQLSGQTGLHPSLIDVIDIRVPGRLDTTDVENMEKALLQRLNTGFSRLKRSDPPVISAMPSVQRALVVGGGIAGMAAALAVADHGFEVDLVEKEADFGGNLTWLTQTIDGHDITDFLDQMLEKTAKHPLLTRHSQSVVTSSFGFPGQFITTIENKGDGRTQSIEHGATILATGGTEAATSSYGYGTSPAIVTHKELDQGLQKGTIKPGELDDVVMIQCVDSREKKGKNYCSRICCTATLKYALHLKEENPDVMIYIFYRDLMAYGFFETYYTRARQNGIVFIQYDPDKRPEVTADGSTVRVTAFEPIIKQRIEIAADLLVLATGVLPALTDGLAAHFGVQTDEFGFFQEADAKWRPVDALKEGTFACGLCLSPRNITETIASAQACAQRALRLIGENRLRSASQVARVHHSLCSRCERCIETCPYGARTLEPDTEQVTVNPVMCQGCGACAAVCPNSASVLAGFKDQQVFDTIDAAGLPGWFE